MDWNLEQQLAIRTLVAALLGGVIGLERLWQRREAGVRTYASVAMGACVFSLISQHIPGGDPARLAAGIVTGIGFLGAGAIVQRGAKAHGLTTAATIWVTAAIGTAVGFGLYGLSIVSTVVVVLILVAHYVPWLHPSDPPENRRE
jgi:putative Mg2+ transporter-C (MgtC) family protein